ncbi:MAG: hypothetical protein V4565_08175 [Bacteroidota bacterium]
MKKLVIILNVLVLLLSSCATQKKGISYVDDIYANPKEVRIEEAKLAAEKKQLQEQEDKRYNDSLALARQAQKDKDEANPYYKDREFKYDDYYDYEYATRVKRFNNNINGLSYYDNYYTNSYWYNQNPYNYGVSVYNGYSWWGSSYNSYSYNPSVNFYSNWGWNCGPAYGYSGYNPYMAGYMQGYNNGFNNGYYGGNYGNPYGYGSPFGYGYGNYGYANPYGYGYGNGNNWGYYNSYDGNSGFYYGFRTSNGGGNSRRTSNPGLTEKREYVQKYIQTVTDERDHSGKFSDVSTPRTVEPSRGTNIQPRSTGVKTPRINESFDEPTRTNNPIRVTDPVRVKPTREPNIPIKEQPTRQPDRVNPPVRQNPVKTSEPVRHPVEKMPVFEAPIRQNQPMQSTPNNNGGSNPPANNGGHRPR